MRRLRPGPLLQAQVLRLTVAVAELDPLHDAGEEAQRAAERVW